MRVSRASVIAKMLGCWLVLGATCQLYIHINPNSNSLSAFLILSVLNTVMQNPRTIFSVSLYDVSAYFLQPRTSASWETPSAHARGTSRPRSGPPLRACKSWSWYAAWGCAYLQYATVSHLWGRNTTPLIRARPVRPHRPQPSPSRP